MPRRHDFVVVETIDFFDEEDAELGPPVTQKDILLLNKSHPEEELDEEAVKAAEAAAAEVLLPSKRVFVRVCFAKKGRVAETHECMGLGGSHDGWVGGLGWLDGTTF